MTRWFLIGALVVGVLWVAVRSFTSADSEQVSLRETTVTAIDRETVPRRASVAPRRVASGSRKSGVRKTPQKHLDLAAPAKGPANVDLAALPDARDSYSSPPLITMSGMVLFYDNAPAPRVPVVAVQVDLDGEMEVVGRTASDEDGSYELAVRHPGQLTLLAQLSGYTVAQASVGLVNEELGAPLQFTQHLVLYPMSSISGKVTDAQGRPLAGAEVGVTLRLNVEQPREINTLYQNYSTVVTTATGEFLLDKLPPWEAQVYATKAGYCMSGTATTAPAENIKLVLRNDGAYIKGRVVDVRTSQPVEGASVQLRQSHGRNVYPKVLKFSADSDGYYTAGPLEQGGYVATAVADNYADIMGLRVLEVEDGVTATGVDFLLHDGYRIAGTVSRLDTGKPVPRADVYIRYLLDPHFGTTHVQADAEGRFLVEKFLPAMSTVKLTAEAPGLRTFQPGNINGTWVRLRTADLLHDVPVEVKMVGEARVRGVVLNEAGVPVPQIEVQLGSSGNNLAENGHGGVKAGDDGRFEIPFAAPAPNFRVYATTESLTGSTGALSAMPGEELEVEIRLRPLPSRPPGMPEPPPGQLPGQVVIPGLQ